ncbi:unnamed protein product [Adineta ricciae]|uniref:Uncharacterized protein n=1 Tax=Adineta ricciae TaxID=249248 RepID=A0A816DKK7_ADIRI|nr:unnamed protein product [Adineta ricciae]
MECFYNPPCIDSSLYYVTAVPNQYRYRTNIIALSFSNESHFRTDTFIQDLAGALFVETWQSYRSYSLFYKACAPIYCSYTVRKSNYYTYSALKVLGLYGGSTILLRLLVTLVMKIVFVIQNRCKTGEVVPVA